MKKLNTEKDFTGWESRFSVRAQPETIRKEKTDDGEMTVVEAVITTEKAAEVIDWEKWEMVNEILLMDGAVIPDTKQIPLLDSHCRFDLTCMKGSIRNLRIESDKLIGDVYFATDAEKEVKLVREGHLTDLSVGYKISNTETVEIQPGQKLTFEINGKNRTVENKDDKKRLLVRTKWWAKEGSLVSIGADDTAKFRSELQPKITAEDPSLQKKLDEALNEINQLKQTINIKGEQMEKEKNAPEKTEEQIRKEERERTQGINSIAERFQNNYKGGKDALFNQVKKAADENWSVDQFRAHVFDNYDDSKPLEKAVTELGMSKKEIDRFSLRKYIVAEMELKSGDVNAYKKNDAEFELEVLNAASANAIKETGVKPQGRIIPADIIAKKMLGERAMTVGTVGDGGYLKGTDHLGSEFVGLLRNRTIAGNLGVRIISGLKGNIDVPKQLTAGTFAWGAEAWAVTDTNMTFGQVTGTPKEGKASQTYTRKLLLQSDPSIDGILNEDMVNLARIGVDLAVFHGAGTNAPTGVAITSGIGDFVGASLDWDAILEAEEDIAVANADMATLKWALSPSSRRILKGREKGPVNAGFLMEPDGKVNGYGSEVSNQITSGYMMFGDWSKVWLMDWNMFDILVNPYKDNTGNVTVVIFVYADVAVSIASALTMADDVS